MTEDSAEELISVDGMIVLASKVLLRYNKSEINPHILQERESIQMNGLKILYRSIQEIPPEKWMEKLALEAETDAAEAAHGYPLPRRLRPLFTPEHSHSVRVEERVFESYADFGRKMSARNFTPELRELDARRRDLVKWEREELFFVDSGMPVPRWMQAVSRKPMTEEEMKEANIVGSPIHVTPEQAKANVAAGKLRILYRIVQKNWSRSESATLLKNSVVIHCPPATVPCWAVSVLRSASMSGNTKTMPPLQKLWNPSLPTAVPETGQPWMQRSADRVSSTGSGRKSIS